MKDNRSNYQNITLPALMFGLAAVFIAMLITGYITKSAWNEVVVGEMFPGGNVGKITLWGAFLLFIAFRMMIGYT